MIELPMLKTTHHQEDTTMKRSIALIAAAAAVLATAVALTIAPAASAATIDQLPNLGYSVSTTALCSGYPCVATGCHDYAVSGYGASVDLGSDCDQAFQTNLDTFVAGHDERKLAYQHGDAVAARADLQTKGYSVSTDYGAPTFSVTGGCGVSSTVDSAGIVTLDHALPAAAPCPVVTTTTAATTTSPAATTTTAPTVTGATSSVTPAVSLAAVAPTTDATDPTGLEARVTALEAQLSALAARVDAIQQANAASWQAFHDALANGDDAATAALAARSAGLNAIYQLG